VRWLASSSLSSRCWLALPLFAGCASHTTTRTIQVNALETCAPSASDTAVFQAVGDFAPGPAPPALPVSQAGTVLGLQPNPQGIVVDIDAGPSSAFWGMADVPPEGDIDVLVWSKLAPCKVSVPDGTSPPAAVLGETIGLVDPRHALVVAGASGPFLLDLSTGVNTQVHPLQNPRTQATITPFGAGGLVAGGFVATGPGMASSSYISGTTEVFTLGDDGVSGVFTSSTDLQLPRAEAGALVLPTGETLLVGGLVPTPTMVQVTSSMEKVSPTLGSAIVTATLETPRTSPTVLRLTNGQIFVGGGKDMYGGPISTAEWFDAGLTSVLGTIDLSPGKSGEDAGLPSAQVQYLYAPLEGGAVLAVVSGAAASTAVVLPACDASQAKCAPVPQAAAALAPPLVPMNPALFPAAHSAPVLWTGTAWLRWDPWGARFLPLPAGGGTMPPSGPGGFASTAADPGLALWVAPDNTLNGFRYDTRGPYVNDAPIGPDNTAPDRVSLPGPEQIGWQVAPADGGPPTPGLTIGGGASVFLTDATFDDVDVTVTMGNAWADIVLRDTAGCEYEIGGAVPSSSRPCTVDPDLANCDFGAFRAGLLDVSRHQGAVTVTINGVAQPSCSPGFTADKRLAVGIHGGATPSVLTQLRVTRGP
jgi:hypothetical protein